MSDFAISNLIPPNVAQSDAVSHTGPVQSQQQAAPPVASAPEDTVKLSESAQAQALYQSGESVSAISSTLGLSASLVDSYLDITQTTSVPTHVATQHSAPATTQSAPVQPAQAAPAAAAAGMPATAVKSAAVAKS